MADSFSTAVLAIYIILAIPVLYLVVKHRRHGLLGWLMLFVFCTIRVIGSGTQMKNPSSSAGSIISSIGLSPLLLATAGILHEARIYRIHNLDKKVEWLLILVFHMGVGAGVALTAAGSAKLEQHQQPIDKDEKIVKVGIVILTLAWAVLAVWAGMSFTAPRTRNSVAERSGTLLLASVGFSLAFIGIRVFYSLVALCTEKAYLNPATGSLAIRVVLGLLPELIATLAYIFVGVKTREAVDVDGCTDNLPMSREHQGQSSTLPHV